MQDQSSGMLQSAFKWCNELVKKKSKVVYHKLSQNACAYRTRKLASATFSWAGENSVTGHHSMQLHFFSCFKPQACVPGHQKNIPDSHDKIDLG